MKYGLFKYDSATKYGITYYDYPRILWAILVDWDGDGSYATDANLAGFAKDMTITRGRDFFLNSDSSGYEPVSTGELTLTLDNGDGRFDPYNTLSPLYPNVIPGKTIYIYVQDASAATNYIQYTGYIDDIQADAQSKTVTITASDLIAQLKDQTIDISVQPNITVNDAVEMALTDAGITNYSVDSDLTGIPYWWVTDTAAFDAIQEICDSRLGTFFIAADGTAKYYNRVRSVTSTISPTQSDILRDIYVKQPWEIVRNSIDVKINTRVLQASGVIWTLRDKPYIAAGQSLEVWGTYSYNSVQCPAINVANPVASTDYLMNSLASGSGVNRTSNFTVAITDFGGSVKVTIANGGANGAYVTLLQVQGQAITTPDPTTVKRTDTGSITLYKTRKMVIDNENVQTTSAGESLAEALIDLHADGRKFPIIRFQARPELQFAVDLFDRISLSVDALGINDAFRVGKIEHRWVRENGQDVITTLNLEPVVNTTPGSGSVLPWTLPVTLS